MNTIRSKGFTLIELLAVIAIIAILVGMTAAGLPRILERARITDVQNDFNSIRTAMTQYYTEYQSYPLAYGFRTWTSRQSGNVDTSDPEIFNFIPYMAAIGEHGATALYDYFSFDIATVPNAQVITRLEFSPREPFPDTARPLYGSAARPLLPVHEAVHIMEGPDQRPYVYAPVNREVFERFVRALRVNESHPSVQNFGGKYVWDGSQWPLQPDHITTLVAPRYDAFVLISVGPVENTFGIVAPGTPDNRQDAEAAFLNSLPESLRPDMYQALALRTYYLATRDANESGSPDFDYIARTRGDEGKEAAYVDPALTFLPDGSRGLGPLIFHQPG